MLFTVQLFNFHHTQANQYLKKRELTLKKRGHKIYFNIIHIATNCYDFLQSLFKKEIIIK